MLAASLLTAARAHATDWAYKPFDAPPATYTGDFGLRFWYGTGPFVILRGLFSSFALDVPRLAALRWVFVQGIVDAIRCRLGPPPAKTAALSTLRRRWAR